MSDLKVSYASVPGQIKAYGGTTGVEVGHPAKGINDYPDGCVGRSVILAADTMARLLLDRENLKAVLADACEREAKLIAIIKTHEEMLLKNTLALEAERAKNRWHKWPEEE